MDYVDPNDPNQAQPWEPPPTPRPWGQGHGQGAWDPSYDPGSNWNNGQAPTFDDPYQQYNGGSPVNAPLDPGKGWEWSGVQSPSWNMGSNSWDMGSWGQVDGRGLGYNAPAPSPGQPNAPTQAGPKPPGAVAPMPAMQGGGGSTGINVPGSGLPQNILDLFAKKPDPTSVQSAFQDALLKYMSKSQQTPSLDDPMLAPQVEVFRAANQRNTERQRRTSVERASATGQGNSGYIDNQIKKGVADQGFQTANFNSQLLGGEMNKRRDELQAALQIARATGDAEAQRALQEKLAQVSAMLQQQGLALQGELGRGDLDLRWAGLGANTAISMEGLNQRALEMIMRGL